MAPRASASAGKEKLIGDDDEVLQAVILADSFNKRFRPLTSNKPRCLLPICNAPLLDWTLESLALAGVQEVFVICRSHAELVKEAIANSRWSSSMKIVPVMTTKETFSAGDAMRDIYTRGLITTDFVLVHMADLVSNIRIDEVVKIHKERRKTVDRDAIMTMVVKEVGGKTGQGEGSVFVMDSGTQQCLHYASTMAWPRTKHVEIPREILDEHDEVEIRSDLLDCGIDICSVDVPSLFQDNFDYLDIRRDFVHGVLTSDLLMKNIYCYVAQQGYAARVKDTKSYDSISKDILSRWTFPLVPDNNYPGTHHYGHLRGNKYLAHDNHSVQLARTSSIGNNTMIGPSTSIGEDSIVQSSIVGAKCSIGANVTIRKSYLFDGAIVEDGCVIEQSIIGAEAVIKRGSVVKKGCLVGDGVVVGPEATLDAFDRVSKRRTEAEVAAVNDEEEDSDVEDLESSPEQLPRLGTDFNGLLWPKGPPEDEDEEDEDELTHENYNNQRYMRLGDTVSDLEESEDDDDSQSSGSESEFSDDNSDSMSFNAHTPLSSSSSALPSTDIPTLASLEQDAEKEFQHEVRQSLERAFAENHTVENASVELKTLRMASNVSLTKVRESVIAGIVEQIKVVPDGAQQRKEIGNVVGRWGSLIDKIGGINAVETVTLLQTHCAKSARQPLFGQILAALYQDDIVEEDDIRKWHSLPASKGADDEGMRRTWIVGAKMIQQFDEQEDSDEDSDGDDAPKPPSSSQAMPGVEESDEEESEEESSEKEASNPAATTPVPAAPTPASSVSAPSSSAPASASAAGDGSSEEEDESDEEEIQQRTPKNNTPPPPSASVSTSDEDSEDYEDVPEHQRAQAVNTKS